MRFSISTAFILLAFTHAASVVTASPVNNNNGGKQGGNANNNNNAANNGNANNNNAQTSLQLDPSVIGPNLAKNGLNNGNGTEAGQAPSITSTNNFINSCVGKTITNGLQNPTGSCNPVPMGDIPSSKNTPSCKFTTPPNFGTVKANTPFDVTMAITGMQTGAFTNPNTNYFAAPQQLNKQGQIIGHSHFVIQSIKGLQDTAPADPTVFAFFQGLNAAAVNKGNVGQLTATVKKGLPAGTYRLFSINTAANHQPVIGPVAQHGSFDDAIYFTVTADGKAAAGGNAGAANAAAGGNAGAANAAAGKDGAANAAAGKDGAANAAAGANAGKAGNANTSANAGNKSSASSSQKAQATSSPQNGKSAQNGKGNSATDKTATAKGAKATDAAKDAQASNSAQEGKGSNKNMNMNMNDKSGNKQGRRDRRFASERNA